MKILWIKTGPLYPLDTGGKKRTHNMLCEIARDHEVTYVALRDAAVPLAAEEQDARYAQHKVWVPWSEAPRGSLRFFTQLLTNFLGFNKPYTLTKYHTPAFTAAIDRLCAEGEFDIIVCDFLFPAPNLRDLDKKPPTVLFQHNMEAQIWKRMAAGKKNPIARWYFTSQFRRMHRWEERLSRKFTAVVTVSPEDTTYARETYRLENVAGDVPTGVDADYFAPSSPRPKDDIITIGFLGSMDWMPNIEAVEWFVRDIYPAIKTASPKIRLSIIGRRPPSSISDLAKGDPSIEVTGTVDDVRPFLDACHLLVVPLLSGGGTRIKIMEALAAELPIVSTTVGAEGLGLVDGQHLLSADTPTTFAEAVCSLANDRPMREHLGENGAALVREHHGWPSVTEAFLQHCHTVLRSK